MKTTKTTPFVQIDAEDLKNYNPVNETLALGLAPLKPVIKSTVFRTVDLWRLRRQRRLQGLVVR